MFKNLSNSAKAALYTVLFSFLSTLGLTLLDTLQKVDEWVQTGVAPDWNAQGKVIISAVVAAAAGVVNYVVRFVQTKNDPTAGPKYTK